MGKKKANSIKENELLNDALTRLLERAELNASVDVSELPPLKDLEDRIVQLIVTYVRAYNHAAGTCNLPDLDESILSLLEDSTKRMTKRILSDLLTTYF